MGGGVKKKDDDYRRKITWYTNTCKFTFRNLPKTQTFM